MKFDDIFVFRKDCFSIGQETVSGKYYLSFPVSNGLVEYEEYYELSKEEFERFSLGLAEIRKLAQDCEDHKEDGRLITKPGVKRGSPT